MVGTRSQRLKTPRLVLAIALALTMVLVSGASAVAADHVVYSDGLANGWHDWSWNSGVNLSATGAAGGSRAIAWQIGGAWAGLYLHADSAVQTTGDSALQFALMASQPNQRLYVAVDGANGQRVGWPQLLSNVGGDPVASQWKWYSIPLSSLGAGGQPITGVVLQDATGAWQPLIKVDEIRLTAIGVTAPAPVSSNCLGVPAYPEVRPENWQNWNMGRRADPARFYDSNGAWRPYYDKIDGACVGTTEQILEWAAKKWGFDQLGYPDLAKAMAVLETFWRQAFIGPAYGEVGILQVNPCCWPDWEPATWSTAYAADYAMAVIRSYYDGVSWLGSAPKGNIRDSVAAWQCGCPYNGWNWYASTVFAYYDSKPWRRPGQPPEWF